MPRRPSEVADVGFSLPGLTSDLQDVIKQQQKIILDEGPVCCSSAGVQGVQSCAAQHCWCFVFPLGMARCCWKWALKTHPGLADTTLLGAQPSLKALLLMGCEQRMKLGCRS